MTQNALLLLETDLRLYVVIVKHMATPLRLLCMEETSGLMNTHSAINHHSPRRVTSVGYCRAARRTPSGSPPLPLLPLPQPIRSEAASLRCEDSEHPSVPRHRNGSPRSQHQPSEYGDWGRCQLLGDGNHCSLLQTQLFLFTGGEKGVWPAPFASAPSPCGTGSECGTERAGSVQLSSSWIVVLHRVHFFWISFPLRILLTCRWPVLKYFLSTCFIHGHCQSKSLGETSTL